MFSEEEAPQKTSGGREREMSEPLTGAALERFDLDARLESIFMPYARRQRDKFYDSGAKPAARFVHYTSAEAAFKIIESKRVWMRNTTCMEAPAFCSYLQTQSCNSS